MIRFRKAKGIKNIEREHKVISTADYLKDFVEVERFIECCKQCPNFGAKWGCPPYSFDVREKYWNNYKYLHLFAYKMYLDEDLVENGMTAEEVDSLVMGIRYQNYILASKWILSVERANPGSFALDGGHCAKCKRCTRPKGKPCRHEDDIRPAVDAIGGNLVKTAEEIFGTKILWIENGKVPEYFLFIVGLLSDSEELEIKD